MFLVGCGPPCTLSPSPSSARTVLSVCGPGAGEPGACSQIALLQRRDQCTVVWGLRGARGVTRAVSWDGAELSLEWAGIWRRREEGQCRRREQLE